MTKKEISDILKGGIKMGYIQFLDPTDADYILGMIKDGDDLEDIFRAIDDGCEVTYGAEKVEDLKDEFEGL